jgi:8-oxo-dGTP pyrophosphatase MutT (NUDIX family)
MASSIPVRKTARVLLIDALDRVLLQFFSLDGGSTGVWITPGGGVEEGESHEEAALRELEEEVGLREVELGPCVWRRSFVISGFNGGGQFEQQELFFVCRIEGYDVSTFVIEDEEERRVTTEQRWWSVTEIVEATHHRFGPTALGELLPRLLAGDYPSEPLVVGR